MKKLLLCIIAACLTNLCFSQTDFRKGYVIVSERDTLFGLVDYREGLSAYKSCNFKKESDQPTITYGPAEIIGYGFIDDKFYASKELIITDLHQTVFVDVLVKGRASLFKFESTFWITVNGQELHQLINEEKQTYVDGKRVVRYTNQHVSTLNLLLIDCAELRPRIQKATLSEKPLINLINDYNRCRGESSIVFNAKKKSFKAVIGISGGINISRIDFTSELPQPHLRGSFEVSESPILGISFDFSSPKINERISLHGDLFYTGSSYYGYSEIESLSAIDRNYVTIELEQLKIPIGIRYTFPERKFTSFFNLGFSSTFHLTSNSTWNREVESDNVVTIHEEEEALPIRNHQIGFWGGLGVLKSISNKFNVSIDLRYEITNGITDENAGPDDKTSKITNFQIVIGIRTK